MNAYYPSRRLLEGRQLLKPTLGLKFPTNRHKPKSARSPGHFPRSFACHGLAFVFDPSPPASTSNLGPVFKVSVPVTISTPVHSRLPFATTVWVYHARVDQEIATNFVWPR